ncbi:hypothetical protein [Chroococcidiopsis sp.]|uniref:hypothetical protein n=1 Tax=Chroococcidiopsis sp. TaxID=3088168 RepID=UPI003F2BB9BB
MIKNRELGVGSRGKRAEGQRGFRCRGASGAEETRENLIPNSELRIPNSPHTLSSRTTHYTLHPTTPVAGFGGNLTGQFDATCYNGGNPRNAAVLRTAPTSRTALAPPHPICY